MSVGEPRSGFARCKSMLRLRAAKSQRQSMIVRNEPKPKETPR